MNRNNRRVNRVNKDTINEPVPSGSHIAAPGPYQEQIAALTSKYPNLKYPTLDAPTSCPTPRVVLWRFKGNTAHKTYFETLEDLKSHLEPGPRVMPVTDGTVRELYLLEGLRPDYIAVLGSGLGIDPNTFMRHRRTDLWEDGHHAGNTPKLPTQLRPSRSFVLDYRELLFFSATFQSYFARAAESNRHIAMSSVVGKFDRVGIVDRRASFWSRCLPSGGWQAILMSDPPVEQIVFGHEANTKAYHMANAPFQGGIPDCLSYESIEEALKTPGPPRTSLLDDLCHYFTHHPSHLQITEEPTSSTLFLKLIIASHYNMLLGYTRGTFDQLESILGRRQNFALQDFVKSVTPFWADLHHFNRRSQYYQHDLASAVLQLGLSDLTTICHASAEDKNFLFLQRQFQALDSKSKALFIAFSNLSGIAGTRQSLLEARNVFRLSTLGVVFLPLSFTSSMFSMSTEYLPGNRHFWIYVVVSISIILFIFLIPLWGDTNTYLHRLHARARDFFLKVKEDRLRAIEEAAWQSTPAGSQNSHDIEKEIF